MPTTPVGAAGGFPDRRVSPVTPAREAGVTVGGRGAGGRRGTPAIDPSHRCLRAPSHARPAASLPGPEHPGTTRHCRRPRRPFGRSGGHPAASPRRSGHAARLRRSWAWRTTVSAPRQAKPRSSPRSARDRFMPRAPSGRPWWGEARVPAPEDPRSGRWRAGTRMSVAARSPVQCPRPATGAPAR